MRVLLVGNYIHDGQESMQRFANVLRRGLEAAGVSVDFIRPIPRIGRLLRGSTGFAKWLGYLDKFVVFPNELRRRAGDYDVVHICDHSNAMYAAALRDFPHLITCHDLLAIRSARGEFDGQKTGPTGKILQRWILKGLRQAQRVTCVSKATQDDLLRLAGRTSASTDVTYMGLNFPYEPDRTVAAASDARRGGDAHAPNVFIQLGLPTKPYILHVGGTQWYKNRSGVIAMYERLRARLGSSAPELVIVGRPGGVLPDFVQHRSGVSSTELAASYSGAEFLLFPSLAEGFGWPIIEAQACRCPVLTTSRDPMMEVGGEGARYLPDPTNAEEGANRMIEMLRMTAGERSALIRAGFENARRFSTKAMIERYVEIYHELAGR